MSDPEELEFEAERERQIEEYEKSMEMPPHLIEHEQQILEQIGFARAVYDGIGGDSTNNENILGLLLALAESGFRLEPDLEGIAAAARDHLLADKADFMKALMDALPPEVKAVVDAAKEAGMNMAIIPIAECTNPDCPVHGGGIDGE